jgi:hypothetical protein
MEAETKLIKTKLGLLQLAKNWAMSPKPVK